MIWLDALPAKQHRGSFPRCLLFMDGNSHVVAQRLQDLVGLSDITVTERDFWMPRGLPIFRLDGKWDLAPTEEARLGQAERLLTPEQKKTVTDWWLAVSGRANTPNWDIASTCTVKNTPGLLLIEAKAYDKELDRKGKDAPKTPNGRKNHRQIGKAMKQANDGLMSATGLDWRLSRDSCYQLSNRFAWSWKLAETGKPVVLVYLGFLNATEMQDKGTPFVSHSSWERALTSYSENLFPRQIWNRRWTINGVQFMPLIRSLEQSLPPKT